MMFGLGFYLILLCHTFEEKLIHKDRFVHLSVSPSLKLNVGYNFAIFFSNLIISFKLSNYSAYDNTDMMMPHS